MRKYLVGGAVALLTTTLTATTLTACRGDDDDNTSSTAVTKAEEEEVDTSSETTVLPARDLRQILDRQEHAVIKATYTRGDDEFTIAQDRDQRSIRSGDSMSIFEGTRTIDCTGLDTSPSCVELDPDVSSIASRGLTFYELLGQSLSTAADTTPSLETTRDVVAGRPAVCAEGDAATFLSELSNAVGPLSSATVRVCMDALTGYLLEYRNDSDPGSDLVATKVGAPSAADFEPPVEVDGAAD
jgi:hypothetical protein